MKKVVVVLVTLVAFAAVFAGSAASRGDGGELVAKGFSCGILDGNGSIFITSNSELWSYQNRSVLRCSGDGAAGPPPHPKYFNFGNTGLSCGMLQFGSTTNWTDKVGAAGNSQLTCYGPASPVAPASSGAGIG